MRFIFERALLPVSARRARRRIVLSVNAPDGAQEGWLSCGTAKHRCAFGKGGIGVKKREGDAITPTGTFALRAALLTKNTCSPPLSRLPVLRSGARAGWCDDVRHPRRYNRPIAIANGVSHECLRRKDRLYDLLIVLGYNDAPMRARRGSAIFLHATTAESPPYPPTHGCIAIDPRALRALLPKLDRRCAIRIRARKKMSQGIL